MGGLQRYLIIVFIGAMLISSTLIVKGMTVSELADSYDYSYYDGTINVTEFADSMADINIDGINDTLQFTITTDALTQGDYTTIVSLTDNGLIANSINKSITSGSPSAIVNMTTAQLTQTQWNYTVELLKSDGSLVYRSSLKTTSAYGVYDKGTTLTSVSDSLQGQLMLTITLNNSINFTANVTPIFEYNNKTISETKELNLKTGPQTIQFNITNSTIQSTHYNGTFNITAVVINGKSLTANQITSYYNYEDFSQSSYVRSFIDASIDTDYDNTTDFLEINASAVIKTAGDYTLQADLNDLFSNNVVFINQTQTLGVGNSTVNIRINGTTLYASKIDGPYVLNNYRLILNGNATDSLDEAYTTAQYSFSQFKAPPRPDLNISIISIWDRVQSKTTVITNVTNIGSVPAINVFLDLFDNVSMSLNHTITTLNPNESANFTDIVNSTTELNTFTAVADFDNVVDENNESNNIAQDGPSNGAIDNFTIVNQKGTTAVIYAEITNTGAGAGNISWSMDTRQSIINSSLAENMRSGDSITVITQINNSEFGNYNLGFNTSANTYSNIVINEINQSLQLVDTIILKVKTLEQISSDGLNRTFRATITNDNNSIQTAGWNFETGQGVYYSTVSENLSPSQTMTIIVQQSYNQSGIKLILANATGIINNSKNISVTVIGADLNIDNFTRLSANYTYPMVFEAVINNTRTALSDINATWKFYHEDIIINGNSNIVIPNGTIEIIMIQENVNPGAHQISFNATDETGATKTATLSDLFPDILTQNLLNLTSAPSRIFEFIMNNTWNSDTRVDWQIDTGQGVIGSDNAVDVLTDDVETVYVQYNYSDDSPRTVVASSITNSTTSSAIINV